jgi:hypothetical protein
LGAGLLKEIIASPASKSEPEVSASLIAITSGSRRDARHERQKVRKFPAKSARHQLFRQVFLTFWSFRSTPGLTWPNTLIRFAIDRLLSHLQAVLFVAALRHDKFVTTSDATAAPVKFPVVKTLPKGFLPLRSERFSPQRSQRCMMGVCGHPERHPSKRTPFRIPTQPFRRNLADRHFELCIVRAPCPSPMHPLLMQRRPAKNCAATSG